MAKRHHVTLSIATGRQIYYALLIPELLESDKVKLLRQLADSGDIAYIRLAMRNGLCKGLSDKRVTEKRLLSVLIAGNRHPHWLAYAFGIETDPNRRTELLAAVEIRSVAAREVLWKHLSLLSPEEQVRLVPIAFGPRTSGSPERLLEEHGGTAPALRRALICSGELLWGNVLIPGGSAARILGDPKKYYPANAPLTTEEREVLVLTVVTHGESCISMLRCFKNHDLELSHEEVQRFISGIIEYSPAFDPTNWKQDVRRLLSDNELLKLFSDEQRERLLSIAG